MEPIVLYIDDERSNVDAFVRTFDDEMSVLAADSVSEALDLLAYHEIGVVVSDQRMPGRTGIELLAEVAEKWPEVSRILLTAYSDTELLLQAIHTGKVHDYVLKPWSVDDLRLRLRRALNDHLRRAGAERAGRDRDAMRDELAVARGRDVCAGVVPAGQDPAFLAVLDAAGKAAPVRSPVWICGEPGAGKQTLARHLHSLGGRGDAPFVVFRCAPGRTDLDRALLGVPAGGDGGRGAIARAQGGTLYLANVELLRREEQQVLVALLGEAQAARGDRVGVRIIASSQRPIDALLSSGALLGELAQAVGVIQLELPPLRARGDDVAVLARGFLDELSAAQGKRVAFSGEALAFLAAYDWPGNVRELRNVIERATVLADAGAVLEEDDFRINVVPMPAVRTSTEASVSVYEQIDQEEATKLRAALLEARGNKSRTARILGIPRTTLNARLRKHGL